MQTMQLRTREDLMTLCGKEGGREMCNIIQILQVVQWGPLLVGMIPEQ